MDRIVVNRSATLLKTFYEDGVAADPDASPTVTVTRRSDGSTVTTGAVADEAAAGTWSVTIPATANTLLDTLDVDWAATINSVSQEHRDVVEVAGGFLFTIAELAQEVTASTTTYTAGQIAAARTYAETELEHACGVAFVPRYALDTVSGDPTSALQLRYPIRAIRSVTAGGTALSVSDLAGLTASGDFLSGYTWPYGTSNIVVGYEHGYDFPSPGASEAALVLAKHKLVRGPIDERATQRPSEFGPVNLATPGMFGSRFGIPVVDAFVSANNMSVGLA